MKIYCKYMVSCFLLLCTFFAVPTFVKAYDYTYMWNNSYSMLDGEAEIVFMGPQYLYYEEIDRYLVPFIILYNEKIIYRGVAEAPRKMRVKNVVKHLCEESHIDMNMKGAMWAKELCDRRKTMKEYKIDEIVETQLYPTFLIPEALRVSDKYFTFTISLGSQSGNIEADIPNDILEVELTPGDENVPEWVHKIVGRFRGGIG